MIWYCLTSPSAGSQRTLRELVVGSVTWRFFTPPRGSERDGTRHSLKQLLRIILAVSFILQGAPDGWGSPHQDSPDVSNRGGCQSQRSVSSFPVSKLSGILWGKNILLRSFLDSEEFLQVKKLNCCKWSLAFVIFCRVDQMGGFTTSGVSRCIWHSLCSFVSLKCPYTQGLYSHSQP